MCFSFFSQPVRLDNGNKQVFAPNTCPEITWPIITDYHNCIGRYFLSTRERNTDIFAKLEPIKAVKIYTCYFWVSKS